MGVLTWILRVLALLLLVRLVMRLLFGRRVVSGQAGGGPGARPAGGGWPGGPQPGGKSGGELVRDPHCGTYVAKARAVAMSLGDETLYFCSATCRDAHRAAKAGHL
jgi:YHS domain-containing protein